MLLIYSVRFIKSADELWRALVALPVFMLIAENFRCTSCTKGTFIWNELQHFTATEIRLRYLFTTMIVMKLDHN